MYFYALYPFNGSYRFNGNLLTKLGFIGFLENIPTVQLFTLFNVLEKNQVHFKNESIH